MSRGRERAGGTGEETASGREDNQGLASPDEKLSHEKPASAAGEPRARERPVSANPRSTLRL
jgi:hypothetical protein